MSISKIQYIHHNIKNISRSFQNPLQSPPICDILYPSKKQQSEDYTYEIRSRLHLKRTQRNACH